MRGVDTTPSTLGLKPKHDISQIISVPKWKHSQIQIIMQKITACDKWVSSEGQLWTGSHTTNTTLKPNRDIILTKNSPLSKNQSFMLRHNMKSSSGKPLFITVWVIFMFYCNLIWQISGCYSVRIKWRSEHETPDWVGWIEIQSWWGSISGRGYFQVKKLHSKFKWADFLLGLGHGSKRLLLNTWWCYICLPNFLHPGET